MDSLRVDPRVIRATAGRLAVSAKELGAQGVGQSLNSAADGVGGLRTARACTQAATAFDSVLHELSASLITMSDSLRTAADQYERADAALGRDINGAVPR